MKALLFCYLYDSIYLPSFLYVREPQLIFFLRIYAAMINKEGEEEEHIRLFCQRKRKYILADNPQRQARTHANALVQSRQEKNTPHPPSHTVRKDGPRMESNQKRPFEK